MAAIRTSRWAPNVHVQKAHYLRLSSHQQRRSSQRYFQSQAEEIKKPPDFAFAFDIDGVLLRSSKPLPKAQTSLKYLQNHQIPFILLTNGGGKSEQERVSELSDRLEVPLDVSMFVQSHTPFTQLVDGSELSQAPLKDKCILVTGGDGDKCRRVAEDYGFTNVITPGDLITTFPTLWPFASPTNYASSSRRLTSSSISPKDGPSPPGAIKIDAVFVFNDPRDWALDTQIILDLLLSRQGYLGSVSMKNGDPQLPNRGYQQDDQPTLYFSNPDLLWAAAYHLPRLGQGAFKEAFRGVWNAVTEGPAGPVKLDMSMFGKPYQGTYQFAEKRLQAHRDIIFGLKRGSSVHSGLNRVYMVGDNPESDILGANQFTPASGSSWRSILVRSGVYSGGDPAHKPKAIVDDVWEAVKWGLSDSGWRSS